MSQLHFIKAPCHQSNREQGFQFAPDKIKEKYDYEIDMKLFDGSIIGDEIKLCSGYNFLYTYISKHLHNNPTHKIITIGGDHSISAGTIPAINERYVTQNNGNFTSDLVVLWIDASPDINDFVTSSTKNLNEMPCASILGLCNDKFVKSKLDVWSNQVIYYGLNEDDDQIELVSNNQMTFFTNKKIKLIGCDGVSGIIKEMIGDRPVHISLDMKVFSEDIVKCVIPKNNKGLKIEDVEKLLMAVKNNIVSMDIVEFNPMVETENDSRIIRELIRYLLSKTFDIKEKSINIFTEDSYFLVYRPLEQEDPEDDIGWYILRGLDVNLKNDLLNKISDDDIITFDIDDETYLITKTNMNEQNEISYYTSTIINDVALFPQEKALMMFELVNN